MKMFSRKNRKGFTLIELIVVIAILAILAAIAIPSFIGITDNANKTVVEANARTLVTAITAYNALHPATADLITSAAQVTATKLGTLYPNSLSSAQATEALKLITIKSTGEAYLTSTAPATSSGT